MATTIIRNTDSKPIYLHLPGGRSLKIPARGQAEVDEADASSSDLALHVGRGNAVIVEPEKQAATGSEQDAAQEQSEQGGAQGQRAETKTETGSQPARGANAAEGGRE